MYRSIAQGPRKLNSGTQADTDEIVSSYFSGSALSDRRAKQLGQHLRGQSPIKAVVYRVIQMTRESQCLHLKVTVGFGVIHERSGPEQAQLQSIGLKLARPL